MRRLIVIGTGGHARVIADAARAMGTWDEVAFVDERPAVAVPTWANPLVGTLDDIVGGQVDGDGVVVAIGRNAIRADVAARLDEDRFATVVHPAASVAAEATLGGGSMVLAGAVVAPGADLGAHCIVNHGASVDHDCVLGAAVHLSPQAALAGNVTVGARTWIGIGAVVINDLTLGEDGVVGAGAAVIGDVAAGTTVVGVPAR